MQDTSVEYGYTRLISHILCDIQRWSRSRSLSDELSRSWCVSVSCLLNWVYSGLELHLMHFFHKQDSKTSEWKLWLDLEKQIFSEVYEDSEDRKKRQDRTSEEWLNLMFKIQREFRKITRKKILQRAVFQIQDMFKTDWHSLVNDRKLQHDKDSLQLRKSIL